MFKQMLGASVAFVVVVLPGTKQNKVYQILSMSHSQTLKFPYI